MTDSKSNWHEFGARKKYQRDLNKGLYTVLMCYCVSKFGKQLLKALFESTFCQHILKAFFVKASFENTF